MSNQSNTIGEATTAGAGTGAAAAMKQAEVVVKLRPEQINEETSLYARYSSDDNKLLGITPLKVAPEETAQVHFDVIGDGISVKQFVAENCPGYVEGEAITLHFDAQGTLLNWTGAGVKETAATGV